MYVTIPYMEHISHENSWLEARSYTGVDTPEPTGKGARDSRMVSGRCQV